MKYPVLGFFLLLMPAMVSPVNALAGIFQGPVADSLPPQEKERIYVVNLDTVTVLAPRVFESRIQQRRYNRLVHNVRVVYPYAKLAGERFRQYSALLEELASDTERRRFSRLLEEEIREEFERDLRRMTFSQGLILIKLIDRETAHTSYDILREYRGLISAVFWQSFGRIFGFNLKTTYDPEGEDVLIEEIVQLIEAGLL